MATREKSPCTPSPSPRLCVARSTSPQLCPALEVLLCRRLLAHAALARGPPLPPPSPAPSGRSGPSAPGAPLLAAAGPLMASGQGLVAAGLRLAAARLGYGGVGEYLHALMRVRG
jgi:hypothetical protein